MTDFSFEEVGVNLPNFQDIEKQTNPLYLTAQCKFHHAESGWQWYVIAGEPIQDDWKLYCYVVGEYKEFGFVMLSELLDNDCWFALTWQPRKIKDLL